MRIPVLLIAALIAFGPAAHAADPPATNGAPPADVTAPPPELSPAVRENTAPRPSRPRFRRRLPLPRRAARAPQPAPRARLPRAAPGARAAAPRSRGVPGPSASPAPSMAPVAHSPTYLSMDFTDVELPVLIKFMSEQTKKNFIFDERVQGKITIISPRRLTLEEAYDVFLSVLQSKGFTTVTQGNTIKIVAAREARQDTIHTGVSRDTGAAEFITRLVPLQNLETAEVVPLVTPLVSKDGMVSAFGSSNTLLLIDSRANIDRIVAIIAELDSEGAPGILRVYPLAFAVAADAAKTLTSVYLEGGPGGPGQAARGRARGGLIRPSRGVAVKFLPDTRTNSLIVHAGKELQDDVADLLKKIDIPASAGSGRINVLLPRKRGRRRGVQGPLLPLGEARRRRADARPGGADRHPGGERHRVGRHLRRARGRREGHGGQGHQRPDHRRVGERLRDAGRGHQEARHPAPPGVRRGHDHGDRRRQVAGRRGGVARRGADGGGTARFIGGANFGIQGGMNELLAGLAAGSPLIFPGSGLVAGGIGGSVTLPDGTKIPAIAAVLRASQANNNLNILSSPHLLTQNNKEAEIIVAENIPFITSTSRDSTNLANVINTVERKDVGITLRITPHIHESEFVSMDIYQEASALKQDALTLAQSASVGPTWTKRSTKTTVLVKSGDTVIISGIMQDNFTKNVSKIPLLGDIPLLGYLFRYTSEQKKKTNLLIMLTPHIIQEPGALSKPLEERQRKMIDAFEPSRRDEVKGVLPPPEPRVPTLPDPRGEPKP